MLSNLPSSSLVRQVPRFWTDFIPGRGKLALPHCKERHLPQILPIRLTYAERFRCIGSACEDTCCQGWSVPVDQAAYEKYSNLPASFFGDPCSRAANGDAERTRRYSPDP